MKILVKNNCPIKSLVGLIGYASPVPIFSYLEKRDSTREFMVRFYDQNGVESSAILREDEFEVIDTKMSKTDMETICCDIEAKERIIKSVQECSKIVFVLNKGKHVCCIYGMAMGERVQFPIRYNKFIVDFVKDEGITYSYCFWDDLPPDTQKTLIK